MDEIQSLKAQLNHLLLRINELESKVEILEKRLNDKDFQVLNETPNLLEK
ncbi:hypothetical protein A0056_009315 [Campylobacter jejuni]|nr:hypothetical protein A0056_009315 [Campylobacter jejuni]SUW99739.1 Uncharacterised protein [Campylobacter jejuni subsp. doylei]